jgi:parvulin-like peptidyl-prolyl isomerase
VSDPKKSRRGRAAASAHRRPPAAKPRGRSRLPLIGFGVLFVALIIGSMIFGGIGQADVPDGAVAVVEDTPGGTTVITQEEFDRALAQVAANERIPQMPKKGTDDYKRLAEAAMQQLINTAWVLGEAEEQGVEVSDREVDAEIDKIISQFGCKPDEDPADCDVLQQRLKQFELTLPDVREQVETGLLGQELEREILRGADPPTDAQIEDYYETFKSQFELPETRDVRLVLNQDRAKAVEAKEQLESDSSDESWSKVAREFSTDTSKNQGGLREGLSEGLVEEPLNTEIFDAEMGEIVGPVRTPLGYYVFELEKVEPARTQTLDEVQGQLKTQLKQQLDAETKEQFIDDYGSRWTARTVCAEGYLFERCDNAAGQNDFAGSQERRQQAKEAKDKAPIMVDQKIWPKPPNTLTPPLGGVGPAGTQIICYLVTPAEGQPDPLTGTAGPQRPHPPGDLEEQSQTPGQVDSKLCGPPLDLGLTGSLPGAGAP